MLTEKQMLADKKYAANTMDARRGQIIAAAVDIFLDVGFDRASMVEIARRANVSKQTLYSHFGSKEALFGEAVNKACREHTPAELIAATSKEVRHSLLQLGSELCSLLFSEDAIRLETLCIAGSVSHPEICAMFWKSGPVWIKSQLAAYFQHQIEAGLLREVCPNLLSRQFMALLCGECRLKKLMGVSDPSDAEVKLVVEEAVDLIIAAYGFQLRKGVSSP